MRIHHRTNASLICTIPAHHLEGLLTVPDEPRYGPWAGKLLTADEDQHTIFAVATDGTVATNALGVGADCFRLVPEFQSLYCVEFKQSESRILKLQSRLLRHHIGEVLVLQAGEVPLDTPALFFTKWNGTSFDTVSVHLPDYFPTAGFFEKIAFSPVELPPVE